jgi:flagellar biosynthesis protein FliR
MIEDLLQDEAVRHGIHQSILLGALVVTRMVALVQIVPYMGGEAVPQTVKMGLALAMAILVYPAVWMQGGAMAIPEGTFAIALLITKEIFVGVMLGFVCALAFEAIRMAGQIIDNTAGLTQATTMVPQLPDRISPTSNFLYQLAIVFFFAVGGHRVFLWALTQSFQILPPHEFIAIGHGMDEVALVVLRLTADAIALGVLMAFPVVAAIMLTNFFLALVNKSAPQINVFFLGMPLKAVLASAVVLLSLEVILGQLLERALDDLEVLIDLMHVMAGAQ